MRGEVVAAANSACCERAVVSSATAMLDRELDRRVARLILGDAGAKRRALADDHQLARAVAMLTTAHSQQALFAAATSAPRTATAAPTQRANEQ